MSLITSSAATAVAPKPRARDLEDRAYVCADHHRVFRQRGELAKFQKWREDYEEKERLEKEEKAKEKVGAA